MFRSVSAIARANTIAAPLEVGSSSEEGDKEDNGENNDDGTGDDTHMPEANSAEGEARLWMKLRDKLAKPRADAITDPELLLGSPSEADVGGHNTGGNLKRNFEDISKDISKDNSKDIFKDIFKDNSRKQRHHHGWLRLRFRRSPQV
jgi:hypothetical protein